MSFAHSRGLCGGPLVVVGVLGCCPLGCGGPAVRLRFSFWCLPIFPMSPSPFSQLLPVCHQGFSCVCCGGRSSRVRGNSTCSFHGCLLLLVLALVFVSSSLPPQYRSVVRFRFLSLFVYRLSGVFCACLQSVFGLLRYLVLLFTTLSFGIVVSDSLFPSLSCQWFSCIFWLIDVLLLWVFLPLRLLPGTPVSYSWFSFWALGALLPRSNLRFLPRRGPPFGPSQLAFGFSALLLFPCPAHAFWRL